MLWLKKRLAEIGKNNGDLVRECDFIQERQWVKNWRMRGRIPSNLCTPENMKQLATALQWSGVQLYIAMGYDMYDGEDISPAELALIERKRALPSSRQAAVSDLWNAALLVFETSDNDTLNMLDETFQEGE